MQFHFNKKQLIRWFYYIIGMLILAMGLTLNAESNLGSSPIISIPYTLSFLWPVSFANLTLALYVLFVMLEFILKGKNRHWTDILQIPLSIVFTRFLDLFTAWFDFTDSGFAAAGRLVGVGLGTLIAMIGVGRVIALFNHLFQEKLKRQAFPG